MKTNTANRTSEGARYARPIANDRRSRAVHRITSRHRTVTFVQTRSVTCTHEPKILAAPRAKICEGCGSTYNLRLCADCGYVGCCESQKGHDRTHALETDHHVIKSLPLGEGSFTWCYACERYI
ncbi:MAG: UBP-type zinc finger domain-containing protein [Chloroflexi bacterium]|nr:MAG: UBP-type zinc finger domain-containing protein [Chloroflexota bacterium]TMG70389.1 MAG: UBP-type zinc finger domain-containing protein [Chloroflexota bacterium]